MGVESCGPTFVTTILVSRLTKRQDGYGEIGTLSSELPWRIICSSAVSIWRSAEQDRPGTKHGAAMVRRSDLLARLWPGRRAFLNLWFHLTAKRSKSAPPKAVVGVKACDS